MEGGAAMPKRTLTRLTKRTIDDARPGTSVWDVEVPGFGVRVTPAGARSFIFQFRSRAQQQGRITIGRYPVMTVEDARKVARQHRIEVESGGNPSLARKELRTAPTMNDLAALYCGDYAQSRALKSRTVKDARRLLDRYALPALGSRKVRDVTSLDIRKVQAECLSGSGRYESNRLRAVLSRMFTLAIQSGWKTDNPCHAVEKLQEDQRWDHLSPAQVADLMSACDRYDDQNAANAVRLLLFTGARLNEVLKAEWNQFDLASGIWTKPSSHTKTKVRQRLTLATKVTELLRDMRQLDPLGTFLFPGRDPSKPRADLNRPWNAIKKDAGLERFRRHDLRRTTASFMLSAGADLSAVGKALGHTQPSTTARYAHLFDDVQREGINRAVELMSRPAASTQESRSHGG
jgi:integrase